MKIDIHNETERGDIITLVEPIVETWNGRAIAVPAGFESDGVSTPRFLWTTVSPKVHPQTIRGGICHDFLYRKQPTGWTLSLIRSRGLGDVYKRQLPETADRLDPCGSGQDVPGLHHRGRFQ